MSMYSQFKTNPDIETKGVVIDYGWGRITIARAGGANTKYKRVLAAKAKPYRRAIQTETMDEKRELEVMAETFAETVVLNWEAYVDGKFKVGIEIEGSDKLLPVNAKNITDTLLKLPDLFLDLAEQASKVSLFLEEIRETDAGN